MATEGEMFEALYNGQLPNAVVRHASVGEPYTWLGPREGRVEHSVRRIDALVIRRNQKGAETLWAVEIKVSASDLRHELKTPEKTEAWAQYVDSFYFLVPPELEIIALAEVPPAYGVMVGHRWHTEIKRRSKINRSPLPLPLATWRRLAAALGKRQFDDLAVARASASNQPDRSKK
jgi:hypothetical protein